MAESYTETEHTTQVSSKIINHTAKVYTSNMMALSLKMVNGAKANAFIKNHLQHLKSNNQCR